MPLERVDRIQKFISLTQGVYLLIMYFIAITNSKFIVMAFYFHRWIFITIAIVFLIINVYVVAKAYRANKILWMIIYVILFIITLFVAITLSSNPFAGKAAVKLYGFYDVSNGKLKKSYQGQIITERIIRGIEDKYENNLILKRDYIEKMATVKSADLSSSLFDHLDRNLLRDLLSNDSSCVYSLIGFVKRNRISSLMFNANASYITGSQNKINNEVKIINFIFDKIIASTLDEIDKVDLIAETIYIITNGSFISAVNEIDGEGQAYFFISSLIKRVDSYKIKYPFLSNELEFLTSDIMATKINILLHQNNPEKLASAIIEVLNMNIYYPYHSQGAFYKDYARNYFANIEKDLSAIVNRKNIDAVARDRADLYDLLAGTLSEMPYEKIKQFLNSNYSVLLKKHKAEPIIYLQWGDYLKLHHELLILPRNKMKLLNEIEEKYVRALEHKPFENSDVIDAIINIKISMLCMFRALITGEKMYFNKYEKYARRSQNLMTAFFNINPDDDLSLNFSRFMKEFDKIRNDAVARLSQDKLREH